jgi:hypothetical protein
MSTLHIKGAIAPAQNTNPPTLEKVLEGYEGAMPSAVSFMDTGSDETLVLQICQDDDGDTYALNLARPMDGLICTNQYTVGGTGQINPLHLATVLVPLQAAPQVDLAIGKILNEL